MKSNFVIFLSIFFISTTLADTKCELAHKGESTTFPKGFSFGAGTAAAQVEGAWNADGKAPSIWDIYIHEHPENISDGSNGDNASESYDRFEQDLAALKELKVNFYRFSISWPRVLPKLTTEFKNEKAIAYYNKVIDGLIENNITPIVTMLHFDLPNELLEEYNGFLNSSIIDYFEEYADFLYATFGDRVKTWITINEPYSYCGYAYATGLMPPFVKAPGVSDYICMDNTLRSHAKAYRIYKKKYFNTQQGRVGINFDVPFYYKKSSQTPDEVIERAFQYSLAWFAEPIYGKTGNYPSIMISDIARNSLQEGLPKSRLPVIDDEWSKIIKGSADFMGLNYYTSRLVDIATGHRDEAPFMASDADLVLSVDENWKQAKSNLIYCVPEGFENLLKWIRDNYDNVEVIITENGWPDDGELHDSDRIDFMKAHLQAILNAINDGCNVTHYTFWGLIDDFEYSAGYTEKLGLYYVNFTSENKERIPRDSAKYYTSVIESRKIPTSSDVL